MWGNIIISFSLSFALLPIYVAFRKNDVCTAIVLACLMFASGAYHLVESETHGMNGIHEAEAIMLAMERISAGFVLMRLLSIYWKNHMENAWPLMQMFMISFYILLVSEMSSGYAYVVFHVLWHVLIFTSMAVFLFVTN